MRSYFFSHGVRNCIYLFILISHLVTMFIVTRHSFLIGYLLLTITHDVQDNLNFSVSHFADGYFSFSSTWYCKTVSNWKLYSMFKSFDQYFHFIKILLQLLAENYWNVIKYFVAVNYASKKYFIYYFIVMPLVICFTFLFKTTKKVKCMSQDHPK